MGLNIVLISPEIPQNTGNIGRLCVNTDTTLHLVRPLGFSLEDKYIKRSGMDYWKYLDLKVHDSVEEFLEYSKGKACYFFSTKTKQSYLECEFVLDSYLIFGNEGSGFPSFFYDEFYPHIYTIPMPGKHARSLNLANSVAIVLYEALKS
jgi:tRNA (cytidine/uridine-2'-O-)-methyltransferase